MHMERLSRLLHDAHIDPHTSQLYDNLLDASIWIDTNIVRSAVYPDGTTQFLQLLVEFLRSLVGGRRRSIMTDKAISYSNFTAMKSPQFIFEQTLATALRDPNNKKMVQSRYLERSTLSAIVEEFDVDGESNWESAPEVDVLKESRYLVYRKMSVQANIHLMQTIIPCMDIRNAHTISYILNIFHKFASAFEVKCRYCKLVSLFGFF
uniref:Uncharacterized protein n=1 Tax=Parascaris equorum TaxID=6256 RepID=A0A914RZ28_PAREQ